MKTLRPNLRHCPAGREIFMAVLLVLVLPTALPAAESYISTSPLRGAFTLSAKGKSAALWVSSQDYPGVLRVARILRQDIHRVTGAEPVLSVDEVAPAKEVVIAGTIGRNPLIDRLVRERKLDVNGIEGKWETFLIQTVDKPMPGVDRALVIAGSDKRGAIYGMFDLSSKIGVSPWYWWADVPPRRQADLFVLPGRHTLGPPKVQYRGIFINDEAPALTGWAFEKFGGFNSKFYEKVFELILRMKGNYLWPAMWGRAFYDDDPENPRLADEYGVVIGTSHHEPMMRAHDEWRRYGKGPWNYEKNDSTLRPFWKTGIRRMGSFESIVTVGMRGDGDEPMSEKANISLLERIVKDQRAIIAEVTGKNPAEVKQMWALYKEVQEYFDKGMRVPDDVTLLLCDDNWGNIRKLPRRGDPPRSGGYGIYYHFDYVGGPRNYKWLNTNQISRVWEELHMAFEYGVQKVWIVNVGDIKPMELPTEFFLDYAWDPDHWPAERLPDYIRQWASRQFGDEHAEEISRILTAYTTFNSRRKPELLSPDTYSLTNYREAETVVEEYRRIAGEAERIAGLLPQEMKDAYHQLVLHPVIACANLNDLYVTVAKNRLYALQGRSATNALAARARELFRKDAEITHYYNSVMAGGKWNHMMDQTHIGYTYWQQPDSNAMPEVKEIEVPKGASLGVAVEGSAGWWPLEQREAQLPEIDAYRCQRRFFELFNRGMAPCSYSIRPGRPWLRIDSPDGTFNKERRVWVEVDWSRAPKGRHRVPIVVTGPNKLHVSLFAVVHNPASPRPEALRGYVESDGYVSMGAEGFTRAIEAAPIAWQRVPDLGRIGSAMIVTPVTAPPQVPGGNSPHLEYQVHLFKEGKVQVHAFFSPVLPVQNTRLRYGISFDDQPIETREIRTDTTLRAWEHSVADNIVIEVSDHLLDTPGDHVLKYWMVDPGVVLQKLVIDTGGLKPSYLGPPPSYRGKRL